MLKVLYVTPSFAPAWSYGGPTESSYQLCRHLAAAGCRVEVLSTDADGLERVLAVETRRPVEMAPGLVVRYCRRLLRHSVSPALARRLFRSVKSSDIVHLQAVYSFPTVPTLLACRVLDKPLVWSPRGALQRWEGTRRAGAKRLWDMTCRAIAPPGMVMHVTSEQERRDSAMCMPGVEAAVIANGVPVPEQVVHTPGDERLRLLYLGRFDPKKGLDNLFRACRILSDVRFGYSLEIAGSGPPHYEKSIKALAEQLSLDDHLKFLGNISRDRLAEVFQRADVLVVPSHGESFGIAVAEALAHEVPVIASKGTPWQRVEEHGCGLWVDNDPQSLARAIEKITKLPLREMGERGRRWMVAEYSWAEIARRMTGLYRSLIEGKSVPAPACVETDEVGARSRRVAPEAAERVRGAVAR
jgi:glycosyltransferase involved in cell wall biosynthesis